MAITAIAALAVTDAVAASASTGFTTTSDFILYGDDLQEGEVVLLYRLGPSGEYKPATNDNGSIFVSSYPNMVRVDAPGTFRLSKNASAAAPAVGYEEV